MPSDSSKYLQVPETGWRSRLASNPARSSDSSGDSHPLTTHSKQSNRVVKSSRGSRSPARTRNPHSRHAATVPSTSASIVPTPEIHLTSASGESTDAEPTSGHWNHNDLTKRAYQFIQQYESETKGWESKHAKEVVNTGHQARAEEQGTWFCEYATPAGYSSLTIEIRDLRGEMILSYTSASVANVRNLSINVPGERPYNYKRYNGQVTLSN